MKQLTELTPAQTLVSYVEEDKEHQSYSEKLKLRGQDSNGRGKTFFRFLT